MRQQIGGGGGTGAALLDIAGDQGAGGAEQVVLRQRQLALHRAVVEEAERGRSGQYQHRDQHRQPYL
ncbi:hypothetical protein D3C85_1766070 [compost metagenome]